MVAILTKQDWATNTFTFMNSLYDHTAEDFYHNWILNFIQSFFWYDQMIFILQFANVVYNIADLQI